MQSNNRKSNSPLGMQQFQSQNHIELKGCNIEDFQKNFDKHNGRKYINISGVEKRISKALIAISMTTTLA